MNQTENKAPTEVLDGGTGSATKLFAYNAGGSKRQQPTPEEIKTRGYPEPEVQVL